MFKKFRKVAISVASLALAFMLTANVAFAREKQPNEAGSEPIAAVSDIYGIQGTISYSGNTNIFAGGKVTLSHNLTSLAGNITESAIFIHGTSAASGNVFVNYTIRPDAKAGDSCTITFNYDTSDKNGNMTVGQSGSVTVTVKRPTTGGGSTGGSGGTGGTGVTNPTPVKPTKKSDLTELERLIAIANNLTKSDYTSASWDVLIDALNKAKSMTTSHSQAQVDAAAEALQAAIDGLVKIDYTELLAAIEAAKELMSDTEFANLWNELLAALDNGNANLKGTSQEEVDAAASALNAVIAKLEEFLTTVDAPVVTEPEEGVCTVPFHKLLVILLVVSGGLNVVLGFILYNNSKKNKQRLKDNTPMVKYSASDDDK